MEMENNIIYGGYNIDQAVQKLDPKKQYKPGHLPLTANYEVDIAYPLDARQLGTTLDDLCTPAWWLALKDSEASSMILYKGMIVACPEDPEDIANGVPKGNIYMYIGETRRITKGTAKLSPNVWAKQSTIANKVNWPLNIKNTYNNKTLCIGTDIRLDSGVEDSKDIAGFYITPIKPISENEILEKSPYGSLYIGETYISLGTNNITSNALSDVPANLNLIDSVVGLDKRALTEDNDKALIYIPTEQISDRNYLTLDGGYYAGIQMKTVLDETYADISSNITYHQGNLSLNDVSSLKTHVLYNVNTSIDGITNIEYNGQVIINSNNSDYSFTINNTEVGNDELPYIFTYTAENNEIYVKSPETIVMMDSADITVSDITNITLNEQCNVNLEKSELHIISTSTGTINSDIMLAPRNINIDGYDYVSIQATSTQNGYIDIGNSSTNIRLDSSILLETLTTNVNIAKTYIDINAPKVNVIADTSTYIKLNYTSNKGESSIQVQKGNYTSGIYLNAQSNNADISIRSTKRIDVSTNQMYIYATDTFISDNIKLWGNDSKKLKYISFPRPLPASDNSCGIVAVERLSTDNTSLNWKYPADETLHVLTAENGKIKWVNDLTETRVNLQEIADTKDINYIKVASLVTNTDIFGTVTEAPGNMIIGVSTDTNTGIYAINAKFIKNSVDAVNIYGTSNKNEAGISLKDTNIRAYAYINEFSNTTAVATKGTQVQKDNIPNIIGEIIYYTGDFTNNDKLQEVSYNTTSNNITKVVLNIYIVSPKCTVSWNIISSSASNAVWDIIPKYKYTTNTYIQNKFYASPLHEYAGIAKTLNLVCGRHNTGTTIDDPTSPYNIQSDIQLPTNPEDNKTYYLNYNPAENLFAWDYKDLLVKPISTADITKKYYILGYDGKVPRAGQQQTFADAFVGETVYIDYCSNVYATAYYATSDKRLKDNINDISINSDNMLIPKQFNLKGSEKLSYGFIAQDLEDIGYKDIVYTDTDTSLKKVDYNSAFAICIAQLQKKIQELEKTIENLKK